MTGDRMTEETANVFHLDIPENEFNDYALKQGWTDGLPVIAPTPERVDEMLEHSVYERNHLLGVIQPRSGKLSVETVAVNAVMAGCAPEYFPVVVAAVEAILDEKFGHQAVQTTTSPVGPMLMINGPVRKKLDIACGSGCMGPGFRANMTIGRALRLVMMNPGGGKPGETDKATQGSPCKIAFCFGENEEESPFEPFHVTRGFDRGQSVVHAYQAHPPFSIHDSTSTNGTGLLTTMAYTMRALGSNNTLLAAETVVVFSPKAAGIIARSGFTREQIQRFLYLNSSILASDFPPPAREILTQFRESEFPDVLPSTRVPITRDPRDIVVAVAGGSGNHNHFISSFGTGRITSREIKFKR